jgi:hypothetical protein
MQDIQDQSDQLIDLGAASKVTQGGGGVYIEFVWNQPLDMADD